MLDDTRFNFPTSKLYPKWQMLKNCSYRRYTIKLFMDSFEKWPKILWKYYGVHSARFLKYVWPFIMFASTLYMEGLNIFAAVYIVRIYPAGIYMFKGNNRNTRASLANSLILMLLLLTLNLFQTLLSCFYS